MNDKLKNKDIIFIDLDGTLIKTLSGGPFAKCIIDCTPIFKTWNELKEWADTKNSGYVFIVSNQGGIENGKASKVEYMTAKFDYIKAALSEYINEQIVVDYMFCPSNDKSNQWRKPNTGMLESFVQKYNLTNIEKSKMLMIGDACPKVINPLSFSSSDYDTAINFNIDYLDVTQI